MNEATTQPSATGTDSPECGARTLLFVFAHPDDECFFFPRIHQAVRAGHRVYCAYTTDGAARGKPASVREAESTRVLGRLGVPEHDILFLGRAARVRDGASHLQVYDVHAHLLEAVRQLSIDTLYVLAWEGGHVDHDVAHLVGVAIARSLGVREVHECPVYNRWTAFPFPFRVARMIPRDAPPTTLRFDLGTGLLFVRLLLCYRSQWTTFLGLGPSLVLRYVLRRRHDRRAVQPMDYTRRPHEGALLYETRFGVPFASFREATAAFVADHLLSSPAPGPGAERGP